MRFTVAASLLLLCACPPARPSASTTLSGDGFTVQVSAQPFSMRVVGNDSVLRLETAGGPRATFDAHAYEAQIIPGWDGYRSNERPWKQPLTGTLESFDATHATLKLVDEGGVTFTVKLSTNGSRVRYEQTLDDPRRFNKSALAFVLRDDTHFFGMGQRTATVDHRGHTLYSWSEEGGLGGGEDVPASPTNPYPNGPSMTYFPVPFFHTTHGVSVWVDTTRRSEVHFGSDPDEPAAWRVAVDDARLDLTLYVRSRPLDALDDFTADTGRPLIPPAWTYGPRRRINRGALVDGVPEWQLMRDRKLPITTVDDAMHALPSGSQFGHEAELRAWTDQLHANGFKVMDYNNPYVSATAAGSADDYRYGAEHGYFEQAPDGGPATSFFLSGGAQTISTIDLTNPAAVTWFQSLLTRSLDLGYDGWMHDFGEYVARSSRFADGRTGEEVHNVFSVLSAKAARELLKGRDAMCFVRSGYTGSQAYAYEVWGGDSEASFDDTLGLPGSLRGGLNLGLVGVAYWSTDTGGYKCLTDAPHDKEMLVRWYEMSALSPMMHDEDACSNPVGGERVKARLWDDVETQDIYRTAASLHTRLAPYFRALALVANAKGTPLTRHPFLLFPDQPESWKVEDTFFVGDALYAAPVVRRGVRTRSVWLPPGRYVEWTERTVHTGPARVEVPAPLDRLPLFIVENQLVPLLDAEVQTLAPSMDPAIVTEASRADVLDVVVVLGPAGSASLTLADGSTLKASRASGPATCTDCGAEDTSGQVRRVKVSARGTAQFADVHVESSSSRLIRWEVLTLD